MTYRKKLIEVSLPLEAINIESAREKSIRHGHPSTLHLWWSRKPLAACRAVWWASLVDDPSSWPEWFPTIEAQNLERQRLFDILGRIELKTDNKGNSKQVVRGLVSWDEINNPDSRVLIDAQREIARSLAWNRGEEPPTKPEAIRQYIAQYAPPAYDPFCGGGSIPLEAQRLGLEAHGSDLNPVAVLITKALIEIPPKFKDKAPVHPSDNLTDVWYGAQGLAEDVRYYGQWMRDEAFRKIGHFYPQVKSNSPLGKSEATVIAWLWARTVRCPNPACGAQMPLVRSFELSTKKGKEAWVEPVIDYNHQPPLISFVVKSGKGEVPEGTVNRRGSKCLVCSSPVTLEHIRAEGKAGHMGAQLMAIVAEGQSGRIYLSPNAEHEKIAKSAEPEWKPEQEMMGKCRVSLPLYGMNTFGDLFTSRQLVALTTFSDLVGVAREKVYADAIAAGMVDDDVSLADGGVGARAYSEAVSVYLGFAVDKGVDRNSTVVSWDSGRDSTRNTFARQAIPMTWGFAEANPLSESTGNFCGAIEWIEKVIKLSPNFAKGQVSQIDAASNNQTVSSAIISSDPPYYDNIGYADLADFFYVWLRKAIGQVYPAIFGTMLVPKNTELVATPYRFGGDKTKAKEFFEAGLKKVFSRMSEISSNDYPLTIYYAFKQSESDETGETSFIASSGWETMLEALISSGFSIDGTWPIRSEMSSRSVSIGTNALASSIVLVCRRRPSDALKITKKQFTSELRQELPKALKILQQGNIAPVDLNQASIGPGMAIYSKYGAILEAEGTLSIRAALGMINQILDEYLSEQEGEFDSQTRWALIWYEQYQFNQGLYGQAETLSKAKNTSIQAMVDEGILEAKAGKVRLIAREELKLDFKSKKQFSTWQITQYLIHSLDVKGELATAEAFAQSGTDRYLARDLAYRLYNLCDRKSWTNEATAYNTLVTSWPEIDRLAIEYSPSPSQMNLGLS